MGDDNTTTTEEMVTATAPAEFPNESKLQQGVTQSVGDSGTDQVLPSTNGTDNSTNDSQVSAGEGIKGEGAVEEDLEQPEVGSEVARDLIEEPATEPVEPAPESTGIVVAEPTGEATLESAAEPEPVVETASQFAAEPTIEPLIVVPTITETTAVTSTITEVAVASPVPAPTEPVVQPEAIESLQEQVQPTAEPVAEATQALEEQNLETKVEPEEIAAVADPVVPATIVDPVPTTTTILAEPVVKDEPSVAAPVQLEPVVSAAEHVKEESVKTEPSNPVSAPIGTMAPEQVLLTAPVMPPMAAPPEPAVVATSTTPIAVVAPTVKVIQSAPAPAITTNPLPVSVVPVITSAMKQNGTSGTQPTAKKTTPKPKPKNNVKPNNVTMTSTPGSTPTTTPKKKSKKKQPEPEPVIDEVKKRRKTWTPEEQKYACKQCNFRSAYASSLGRHVQMSHKDNVSAKDESSCGSTSSSTPAPVVTPTQTPAPTPHSVPASPVVSSISMTSAAPTTILTIPKTEMSTPTTIVHQQQPKAEEVNFRHVQILQPQQQLLTYEYHPVVSSTYQDVVNNPPIYNTSIRYDTADGIPITLIDPSTHQMGYNESEFLPFHKTEDDMRTIRSQPTMLNQLGSIAVPVSDIINLPPQSTTLTALTSADNSIDTVAGGLTPDARKRPLVTAVKSKPEDVVAKKRKKEGEGPTFCNVLVSTPSSQTASSNQPGITPTPKKKKKKPAGNNQGGPGVNATPVRTATPVFANSSTPSAKGKADKNGDETPGKKKKAKKPSDKPSNPCLITSTSSTCPVCSFSTKYQFNLARHFQATHKDELQKVLAGTVSYPGIRKREMKEKSTKSKPKSKEKKPKQPGGNDQSSQSSQYSSSQNNSSQLSVAQEFENFVRDENLEMFAEADNLDLSEPMVSSFIESLFSADMGAAEGWNNVGNHQVVLNPSVHQQTIATTAYIQHPAQPGTQMQAVSQGGYVTTVDLLPHQTQAQVVGGYITQPQQLYEFQKAPHSNPIQANVVINGVTTTMDLNSVIEKNTSQLHSQPPESSSHQSHSKVFIAQSSESHTTAATAGVALDHSSQHYQGQQQNGFTGHLCQHLSSTDQHHPAKWASQQQQQVIISSSAQNQQHQWSQSQVYPQQPQQYAPPVSNNPPPATVQYHTPAGTIISHPIEAPPFAQWQSQPQTQQIHQSHPVQSTIQISAESRSLSTVDTSFLHSSLTDNSHHQLSSTSHGSIIGTGPSNLVASSNSIANAASMPPTGSAGKRPSSKKKKKVNAAQPSVITPPPSGKKKTDVESLSPEEREKRERYLQKRRERWKVSQERKKQLKNAQNVDGGSNIDIGSTADSNSLPSGVPVNQHSHHVPPHSFTSLPHVSSHLSHQSSAFLRLDESFLPLQPSRSICSVTSAIRSPIFSLPSGPPDLSSSNAGCHNPYLPPLHMQPTVTKEFTSTDSVVVSPIKQLTLSAVLALSQGGSKPKKQVTFSNPEIKLSREDARREYLRNYNKNRPPRKKATSDGKVNSCSVTPAMPPKRGKKKLLKSAPASEVVASSQKSHPLIPLNPKKKALKSALAIELLASPQKNLSVESLSISSPAQKSGSGRVQKPKNNVNAKVPVVSAANHGNADLKHSVRGTPRKALFLDKTPEERQAMKKKQQAQCAKERHEAMQERRRRLMEPDESNAFSGTRKPSKGESTEKTPRKKRVAITTVSSNGPEVLKVETFEPVVDDPELTSRRSLTFNLPNIVQKCSFPECHFVANNVFELEFHENIHRTTGSLPLFFAEILESSGKLPAALSLHPCIDSIFDRGVAAESISQQKADDKTKLSSPSTRSVGDEQKASVR